MSILTRDNVDVNVQAIAPEWIGQHEPTPLDLLIEPAPVEPTADEVERWVCDRPRYELKVAGDPYDASGGYFAWDRMNDREVGWFRRATDAMELVEDMNNEDFAPLLVGTLPWYEAPYPVADWDGPRFAPTRI